MKVCVICGSETTRLRALDENGKEKIYSQEEWQERASELLSNTFEIMDKETKEGLFDKDLRGKNKEQKARTIKYRRSVRFKELNSEYEKMRFNLLTERIEETLPRGGFIFICYGCQLQDHTYLYEKYVKEKGNKDYPPLTYKHHPVFIDQDMEPFIIQINYKKHCAFCKKEFRQSFTQRLINFIKSKNYSK